MPSYVITQIRANHFIYANKNHRIRFVCSLKTDYFVVIPLQKLKILYYWFSFNRYKIPFACMELIGVLYLCKKIKL